MMARRPPIELSPSAMSPPWLLAMSRAMARPRPVVALVLVARVVEPVERLEHVVALGRGNARAVVVDLDAQPVALGGGADDDLVAEARGVGDEVGDGALEGLPLQRQHQIASRRLRSLSSIGTP